MARTDLHGLSFVGIRAPSLIGRDLSYFILDEVQAIPASKILRPEIFVAEFFHRRGDQRDSDWIIYFLRGMVVQYPVCTAKPLEKGDRNLIDLLVVSHFNQFSYL